MPLLRTRRFSLMVPEGWVGGENEQGTVVLDFPQGSLSVSVIELPPGASALYVRAATEALREHEHDWSEVVPVQFAGRTGQASLADVGERRLHMWLLPSPSSVLHATLDCLPAEEEARVAEAEAALTSLRGGRYAAAVASFVAHARGFFGDKGAHVSEDGSEVHFSSGRRVSLHHAFLAHADAPWLLRRWRTRKALERVYRAECSAAEVEASLGDFATVRERLRVRLYPVGNALACVGREDFEGIVTALTVDTAESWLGVPSAAAERWTMTLDQAYVCALRNVAERTEPSVNGLRAPHDVDALEISDGAGFAAVHALLPERHPQWFGRRGALFILGKADWIHCMPLREGVGLQQLQEFARLARHLGETGHCTLSTRLYWVFRHRILTLPWQPFDEDQATLLPSPALREILAP